MDDYPAMSTPRVSIGMPVYNGEKYIRRALDSLLSQSYENFELIVSDNASTDSTLEICREYAERDKRIRLFSQPRNMGQGWNFYFVLEQAEGDYFMWAACDDFWEQDCLAKYVRVLDDDPSVMLVFCCYKTCDYGTGEIRKVTNVLPSMLDNRRNNLFIRFLNSIPSVVYGLFRKSFLVQYLKPFEVFDLMGIYLSHLVSVYGKIFILSDYLYCAGIKPNTKKPYSIQGSRMNYWLFFIRNVQLICHGYGVVDAIILLIFFVYFFVKLVITTERL